MGLPFIIGVIVVVAIVMGIAGIYNNLVTLRNRVDNAWQNIDTNVMRFCAELLLSCAGT